MTAKLSPAALDDRDLYPLHEEDDVTEIPFHERQVRYLRNALSARFPDWFVTGNVCIYWERGNYALYRAPDVFVVREPLPQPDPRVYLAWQDPPVIFVAEIGSRSTQAVDEGPKVEIYAQNVRAAEYLYSDPPQGDVRLWRLGPEGYEAVAPGENGRLRSAELQLEFGLEERFLRVYTLDGARLRTHEEAEQEAQEAGRRVTESEERAAAEARRRAAEARRRQAAEARAAQAEERAAEEAARRQELERQLAELRARMPDGSA
jgi:Uma2 family endonuclease